MALDSRETTVLLGACLKFNSEARVKVEIQNLTAYPRWKWLGRQCGGNLPIGAAFLRFQQRWPLPPHVAIESVCRVRGEGIT